MQDGGLLFYSGISDSRCMFVYICLCTYTNYGSGMRPYTPPHACINPISSTCFVCFGFANALVSTSAVCSGSQQLSILTTLFSTRSLIQCRRVVLRPFVKLGIPRHHYGAVVISLNNCWDLLFVPQLII